MYYGYGWLRRGDPIWDEVFRRVRREFKKIQMFTTHLLLMDAEWLVQSEQEGGCLLVSLQASSLPSHEQVTDAFVSSVPCTESPRIG